MFLPIWLTVLAFYVLASLLVMSAVFRLSWLATKNPILSFLSTIAVLIFTPQWNLGGNEIMNRMLVPSTMAWALVLWGLVYLYQEREVWAGLLVGIAAFLQPLVSLQIALLSLLTLGFLVLETDWHSSLRRAIRFIIPFAIVASPVLIPLILDQLRNTGSSESLYIIAAFRNPHHYLPDAFPLGTYIKFTTLAVFGGLAFSFYRSLFARRFWSHAVTMLLGIAVILVVALLGTVVFQHSLITKLQLFKLSALAKVILIVGLVAGTYRFVPSNLKLWLEAFLRRRSVLLLSVSLPFLIAVGVMTWSPASTRTLPGLVRETSSEGQMLAWIRANTNRDAVFAVPPTLSGFRYRAERAIFVDFKAFPFRNVEMIEWYRRLLSEAPIERLARGGIIAMQSLDNAYDEMSSATVERLVRTEGVEFILRRSELSSESKSEARIPGLELVHQQGAWWLYRFQTQIDD
ncbi:MAG: hypothetical protein BMS9Abin05_0631 [Rhodothermia bacterium]|nr:MAG: hypothetical protein BMS9Abin05_0631 [Rhodothermia bacterium]